MTETRPCSAPGLMFQASQEAGIVPGNVTSWQGGPVQQSPGQSRHTSTPTRTQATDAVTTSASTSSLLNLGDSLHISQISGTLSGLSPLLQQGSEPLQSRGHSDDEDNRQQSDVWVWLFLCLDCVWLCGYLRIYMWVPKDFAPATGKFMFMYTCMYVCIYVWLRCWHRIFHMLMNKVCYTLTYLFVSLQKNMKY